MTKEQETCQHMLEIISIQHIHTKKGNNGNNITVKLNNYNIGLYCFNLFNMFKKSNSVVYSGEIIYSLANSEESNIFRVSWMTYLYFRHLPINLAILFNKCYLRYKHRY